MSGLTARLVESVVREQIKKLGIRIEELSGKPARVQRARTRYIRQDFNKLERVARKWGLINPA